MATALRLALSGGASDRVRIGLSVGCAALATVAVLCAAIVGSISGTGAEDTMAPYSSAILREPGLRFGVVLMLVVLCVPVLFLVGQASRFGAPARDRRLAAVRMAGATPSQTSNLVAVETGLATLAGTVLGLALVFVGRLALDNPDESGIRPLPTDVAVPVWAVVVVLAGLPAVSAGFGVLALRRVRLTPFGVVRRRRTQPPRIILAVLVLAGVVGLCLRAPLEQALSGPTGGAAFGLVVLGVVLVVAVSLVLGAAAVSAAIGGWVAGCARRPDWLIAGRRLVEDPFATSRALGALFVCIFVTTGMAGVREWVLASVITNLPPRDGASAHSPKNSVADPILGFHQGAFDLLQLAMTIAIAVAAAAVLVALVEQLVERRRSLAALSVMGTSRGVLARASMLQIGLPMLPGVAVAAAAGWLAARGLFGWQSTVTGGGYSQCFAPAGLGEAAAVEYCAVPDNLTYVPERSVTIGLGLPWESFAVIGGGAVLGTLLLSAVSLVFLRISTQVHQLRAEV